MDDAGDDDGWALFQQLQAREREEAARRAAPARRARHDGWTRARQARFLERLGETGCVRDACAAAGLSSTSAYRAYARSPGFAAEWDRALAVRKPMLEDAAFERAVNGVTVPLTRLGQVVGEKRRYSDGLLRYLLERADRMGREGAARDAAVARRGPVFEVATQEELDRSLLRKLGKLGRALKRQEQEDPEAAARQRAEDERLLAHWAEQVPDEEAEGGG